MIASKIYNCGLVELKINQTDHEERFGSLAEMEAFEAQCESVFAEMKSYFRGRTRPCQSCGEEFSNFNWSDTHCKKCMPESGQATMTATTYAIEPTIADLTARIAALEAELALRDHEANEAVWTAAVREETLEKMTRDGWFYDDESSRLVESAIKDLQQTERAHEAENKSTYDRLASEWRKTAGITAG